MNRNHLLTAVAAAALVPAIAARAQLVSEQVQGNDRHCVYERQGATSSQRDVVKVGLAEPCPPFRPFVAEEEPSQPVPIMAQLRASRVREGRRICIYTLAGRDYEQMIETGLSCTISPRRSP